jgi:hypothetical protein
VDLLPDWKDLIQRLNESGADYMLVGAFAVAYYGSPRYTGDIDFWIRPTAENIQRVVAVLNDFGFKFLDLQIDDFMPPQLGVHLGHPPGRVDIMSMVSGVDFDEAWPHRVTATIDGITLPMIGRKELIKNKRASGRPKDDLDAMNLEAGI